MILDCCQLEDSVQTVKREGPGSNDPENGSPDADRGGRRTRQPLETHGVPDQVVMKFVWPEGRHPGGSANLSPPDADDGASERGGGSGSGAGSGAGAGSTGSGSGVNDLVVTQLQMASLNHPK